MKGLAMAMTDAEAAAAKSGAERRRFRRVRVDLPGRLFIPADSHEARCTVTDLSPGGAAIACETVPEHGTPVILYLDNFGRFEGTVARRDGDGFGIAFVCTPSKRERIAEQLMLFLNKTLADDSILRRHERSSQKGFAKFTRADGQVVKCEVMDISVGGVSHGLRQSSSCIRCGRDSLDLGDVLQVERIDWGYVDAGYRKGCKPRKAY